jgi:hypothetical protein
MHKEIADKWVTALRSGQYRKTTGKLCRVSKNGNKSWCCLGVLTDLYNKEYRHPQAHVSGGFLSSTVENWSGMCSWDGKLRYNNDVGASLSKLNDCKKSKRSFKRIADIIEKNWEQL